MSFKIGDIITGICGNGYAISTEKSLLLVTDERPSEDSDYEREMLVIVLYHNVCSDWIKDNFWVNNSDESFKHTTIEEFESNYPDCYRMEEEEMETLLRKYKKEYTYPNAYVLSDEMRNELLEEMRNLLITYNYHPTDSGLNRILDEWCRNKADLIRLFEKHPNYNGKFQIAFDCDFDREFDVDEVCKFKQWLNSKEVEDIFLKEVKIGDFSYVELVKIIEELKNVEYIFRNFSSFIETINGKRIEDYHEEYNYYRKLIAKYQSSDDIITTRHHAYDAELYRKRNIVKTADEILCYRDTLSQFINGNARIYIDDRIPEANIKVGQKMSRAINKLLTMAGVNKLPDYNKEFAKFSDAINPLKIKRHTVISIHPIDFYTMSFGNSWSSCHTIDRDNKRNIDSDHNYRGCNSSGTESYMLDKTSCVFYTVNSEYNGNELELENKINRCMFHYYDNQLLQGRVYPQSNYEETNSLYKDIREIVQKVFADILKVPNYWKNKGGTSYCYEVTESKGTHYKDYLNFDNCNVSTLKDDRYDHEVIRIGHYPICPCCGSMHGAENNIECCY